MKGTHYTFAGDAGFLRVTCRGAFPSATYRQMIAGTLAEADAGGYTRVLIDGRGLSAPAGEMDRFHVGVAIAEAFGSRIRVAVLFPAPFINKFAENAAVNRGADMLVVADEDVALRWLLAPSLPPAG